MFTLTEIAPALNATLTGIDIKFTSCSTDTRQLQPKAIYIAVAVLPSDVLEMLEPYADEIFFLHDIDDYVETSLYYEELDEFDDEIIEKLLEEK